MTVSSTASVASLDDLYHMVAFIYGERNAERAASATFAHFVEVCGMLTANARDKRHDVVSFEESLCKALGWFFPLLAKFKVTSAEELIFRKFPAVCPYCRLQPHRDDVCKTVEGTENTVNHAALRQAYDTNHSSMPRSLDEWQKMFASIYPRTVDDKRERSILGLMEELGELAEAVRVFDRHPRYFAGEAADVFSYLMGLANEHTLREKKAGRVFSLQRAFVARFPGLCVQCGYGVCVCPVVPDATVGRLGKELELAPTEKLFNLDDEVAAERARAVAATVLEQLGGYAVVAKRFPFDRGDGNRALVLLCLRLADAVEVSRPEVAHDLRDAAVHVGATVTHAGSRDRPWHLAEVEGSLTKIWSVVGAAIKPEDKSLVAHIGRLLIGRVTRESCRLGVVTALPKEFAAMRAMLENPQEMAIEEDPNDYVVGVVPALDGGNGHGVVLTLLKDKGNIAASSAATNLARSFRNVGDVLMVGIAGGAPNAAKPDEHVRLGDVVVCDNKGVLQYDDVKREAKSIRVRDNPVPPSPLLIGRVNMLEAARIDGKRPWEKYIERGSGLENCARPPDAEDRLLSSAEPPQQIEHPSDPNRRAGFPRVHYGRIGSAHTLLKDPTVRDHLRDSAGIRAFEMEGSGIADGTWQAKQGYLVVRGISDYCDSGKNDLWQGHAAVVAAAYARALIESVPSKTE